MTEKINHADEAWKLIERYAKANMPSAEVVAGMMQAHATLALAAEQRTANLIAYFADLDVIDMNTMRDQHLQIKEGLGL